MAALMVFAPTIAPEGRVVLPGPVLVVVVGVLLLASAAGMASFCAWVSRVLYSEVVQAKLSSREPLAWGAVAVMSVLMVLVLRELPLTAFAVFAGAVALVLIAGRWLDVADRQRPRAGGGRGSGFRPQVPGCPVTLRGLSVLVRYVP